MVSLVGRIESFDGLENEGIDDLLVIVPVETLLLQNGVEILIALYQRAVDTTPELTVGLIILRITHHILLVEGTLLYLVTKFTYRLDVVLPAHLFILHKEVELLILLQLCGKLIERKTLRRGLRPLSFRATRSNIHTTSLLLRDGHNQPKKVIV